MAMDPTYVIDEKMAEENDVCWVGNSPLIRVELLHCKPFSIFYLQSSTPPTH